METLRQLWVLNFMRPQYPTVKKIRAKKKKKDDNNDDNKTQQQQ